MAVQFPKGSACDPGTWKALSGLWHPAARPDELTEGTSSPAQVLDVPLVDCCTSSTCPAGPATSRIFITLARNYDRDQPIDDMIGFQTAVNAESRGVTESQRPMRGRSNPGRTLSVRA